MVLVESPSRSYVRNLDQLEDATQPLVRKRGFVQLVTERPSTIELPQRCLPVYLFGGPDSAPPKSMSDLLRRLEVLDLFRTTDLRRVVVMSVGCEPIPDGLSDLWEAGLRTYVSFVSDHADAHQIVGEWAERIKSDARPIVSIDSRSPRDFANILREAYTSAYPDDRTRIRIRGGVGEPTSVDISFLDNPDRPVLGQFTIIEEKDLVPLLPDELAAEELEAFFAGIQSRGGRTLQVSSGEET